MHSNTLMVAQTRDPAPAGPAGYVMEMAEGRAAALFGMCAFRYVADIRETCG